MADTAIVNQVKRVKEGKDALRPNSIQNILKGFW